MHTSARGLARAAQQVALDEQPQQPPTLAERSVLSTNGVVRGIRWGFGLGPA
jgi:hypothetical protein